VLYLIESIEKLQNAGIDSVRLNVTDENNDTIRQIVDMHKEAIQGGAGSIKRHRDIIEKIKAEGFTKGHYFRGV
jgi:U32 family peptidase